MSLLLAAADPRVRAVAADITWNDLAARVLPQLRRLRSRGVQALWLGALFGNGFGNQDAGALGRSAARPPAAVLPAAARVPAARTPVPARAARDRAAPRERRRRAGVLVRVRRSGRGAASASCGNFAPDVCAAYQASAATGKPTPALLQIMRAASPSTYLSRIRAPTLLTQGEQDSLFPLSEADANARGIAAHGTPVRVVWRPGRPRRLGVGQRHRPPTPRSAGSTRRCTASRSAAHAAASSSPSRPASSRPPPATSASRCCRRPRLPRRRRHAAATRAPCTPAGPGADASPRRPAARRR